MDLGAADAHARQTLQVSTTSGTRSTAAGGAPAVRRRCCSLEDGACHRRMCNFLKVRRSTPGVSDLESVKDRPTSQSLHCSSCAGSAVACVPSSRCPGPLPGRVPPGSRTTGTSGSTRKGRGIGSRDDDDDEDGPCADGGAGGGKTGVSAASCSANSAGVSTRAFRGLPFGFGVAFAVPCAVGAALARASARTASSSSSALRFPAAR